MDGITLEKLQVIIEAYTKPYRDELDKVKQKTTQTTAVVERQTSKMSKSYSRVGAGIKKVLAALSVAAIVAFGKSCIRLGSDLAEVQNVVDVTFGKMSGAVDAFSKNAIAQFGLSELTAKKYMGTYGAMAKSFGIAGEAGYQMSAAITGLTGDVASFYNLSTDTSYTKLKSIFTGETESLKELGVVMTQSALDQYALQNGFGKTTDKMSEAEKVMLRYKFVMAQLSDASGDFSRTSQGWANQTRVLALQFESLKATIGQGLINAFTPVIRVINTILAKLQTLASYFKAFTAALFGNAGGSGGSLGDAADSSGQIADNMDSAAESAKKMKEYTLGIDELNVINPDGGGGGSGDSGGGGVVPDFGDMSGELFGEVTVNPEIEKAVQKMKEALNSLKDAAKPTTDAIKRLWNEGLSLLGKFTWTALGDFWDYFLVPLGKWVLGEGFPRFIDITNNFLKSIDWDKINEALRNFWKALEPFATKVGKGLLDFYEDLSRLGAGFINIVVPGGLQGLADALESVDADKAEQIGYALGVLAASLASLSLCKAGVAVLTSLASALPTIAGLSGLAALAMIIGGIRGDLKQIEEIGLPEWQKENRENNSNSPWKIYGEDSEKSSGEIAADKNNANPYKEYGEGETWLTKFKNWQDQNRKIREEESGAFSDWVSKIQEKLNIKVDSFKEWQDKNREARDSEKQKFSEWWDHDVAPWFTSERWLGLYESVKSSLNIKWKETVGVWETDIQNWWNAYVSPWFTAEKWSRLYSDIKVQLKNKWDSTAGEWGAGIKSWWNQHVSPWFTAKKWFDLYQTVKTKLKETWDNTVSEWGVNIQSWWDEHVAPWFTIKKWLDIYKSVKESLGTTWTNTVTDWKKSIGDWWERDVEKWFKLETWTDMMKKVPDAFKETFKGAINAAITQLNKLIDWVNKHLRFDFDGLEILGEEIIPSFSVQLFTIPHIPTFANGGFPEDGLFMANHGELVGKFSNGRTAVANNDQITQGIKEAVIEGMGIVMESYMGSSGPMIIETHVDMDGRAIVKQTDIVQNRKGFDFKKTRMV